MKQLVSIIKLTVKEIIKGRVFSLSILFGIFFSMISLVASEISYGNKLKISYIFFVLKMEVNIGKLYF